MDMRRVYAPQSHRDLASTTFLTIIISEGNDTVAAPYELRGLHIWTVKTACESTNNYGCQYDLLVHCTFRRRLELNQLRS